jgi:hypothetical protein
MDAACLGQDNCTQWAELFGSPGVGSVGIAVAVDAMGNSVMAGNFSGSMALPGGGMLTAPSGQTSIFVLKVDPTGKVLWSNAFGSTNSVSLLSAVAVDPSGDLAIGGFVGGSVSFDGQSAIGPGLFVTKITTMGITLWSKGLTVNYMAGPGFGFVDDLVAGLAMTAQGDVAVAGWFRSPLDFGNGALAMPAQGAGFVAMLRGSDGSGKNADGYWGKALCSSNCPAQGVAVDAMGNVVLVGTFQGTMTLGLGSTLTAAGNNDLFLGKLAPPLGTPVWQKQIGAPGATVQGPDISFVSGGPVLALDATGGPTIIGTFSGTVDFGGGSVAGPAGFIARYRADQAYAPGGKVLVNGTPNGVAVDASGNVFLAGSFTGSLDLDSYHLVSAGGQDIFVARLSSAGAFAWSRRYGDASDQWATSLALTPQGEPVVVGFVEGTADFGLGPLMSSGTSAFVAKLSP